MRRAAVRLLAMPAGGCAPALAGAGAAAGQAAAETGAAGRAPPPLLQLRLQLRQPATSRWAPPVGRRSVATSASSRAAAAAAAATAQQQQQLQEAGVDIAAKSPARRFFGNALALLLPASMAGVLVWGFARPDDAPGFGSAASPHQVPVAGETLVNWSATHSAAPKRFYQPETQEDVEAVVADCAAAKRRLRVMGSGLSPNALGFSDDGVMSMALLDRVLWVDPETRRARVEAGCRVQQVADALRPYGLSLANYASIREQQIGGFTQVSAHGTGQGIPPVDEQVVALKLVTPAGGVLELSADGPEPELFHLARVGLGCLGVVTELTLQAVPLQRLRERTFIASRAEVARRHAAWLRGCRHLRYMWIPYTDSVVVVQVNPDGPAATPRAPAVEAPHVSVAAVEVAAAAAAAAGGGGGAGGGGAAPRGVGASAYGDAVEEDAVDERTRAHRLEPLRSLLREALSSSSSASGGGGGAPAFATDAELEALSATELRDALLAAGDALDVAWVRRVNAAEAEFWKRSAGERRGYADQILGFDCGGQQWVHETAFPIGRRGAVTSAWRSPNTDLAYMRELLAAIEAEGVPAPAPIEQRWTASSASPMSPAAAGGPLALPPDTVHSWVGVIMYLPDADEARRAAITDAFRRYAAIVTDRLLPKYRGAVHWAKVEPPPPGDRARLAAARAALRARFPLAAFDAARARLDPDNILGSDKLDALLREEELG